MTEEEYFRKNYPNSCYGDKPLSPHWDFFQDGVEFGEQQSEKRIEELEKENAELEQENSELLCQKNRNKSCYSCANATEKCFRNEIGCPCQNYKSYKDENAELKKTVEHYRKEREFFIGEVEK